MAIRYPTAMHASWKDIVMPLFGDAYLMNEINAAIQRDKDALSPVRSKIFTWMRMPADQVRMVIVGQDPYPDPRLATGIAFAIPEKAPYPLSLKVIVDSLHGYGPADIEDHREQFDRTLGEWEMQGVLMLNRYMTCISGKPGSHAQVWDAFTPRLIKQISLHLDPCLFIFMGSKAKALASELQAKHNHLGWMHPAATRYGKTFDADWKAVFDAYKQAYGESFSPLIPF